MAGTVNINDGYSSGWASVDAPMGGMKASGVGRRHGREGLLKYTESQTVAVRSALAEKLQEAPNAGEAAKRFTQLLRSSQWLPFEVARIVSGRSEAPRRALVRVRSRRGGRRGERSPARPRRG